MTLFHRIERTDSVIMFIIIIIIIIIIILLFTVGKWPYSIA